MNWRAVRDISVSMVYAAQVVTSKEVEKRGLALFLCSCASNSACVLAGGI